MRLRPCAPKSIRSSNIKKAPKPARAIIKARRDFISVMPEEPIEEIDYPDKHSDK